MRFPTSLAAAAAVAGAALALGRAAPPSLPSETPPDLRGCKPAPPVELTVVEASLHDGVAVLAYDVRSLLDAERVTARLSAPAGAAVLAAKEARIEPAPRGALARGRVRVRLDGADAASLRLIAEIAFRATGGPKEGALETHRLEVRPFAGAPAEPDLPRVRAGDVVSLDVPAVRRGGKER